MNLQLLNIGILASGWVIHPHHLSKNYTQKEKVVKHEIPYQ